MRLKNDDASTTLAPELAKLTGEQPKETLNEGMVAMMRLVRLLLGSLRRINHSISEFRFQKQYVQYI